MANLPNGWVLALLTLLPCVVCTSPATLAECDQPDAPDCTCFFDTGVWDAGGPSYPGTLFIQDVAWDTFGMAESCRCPDAADPFCNWDPDPSSTDVDFKNSGQPYYQITLGYNTRPGALFAAELMATNTVIEFHPREEWCSETVSYWHREAAVPYLLGFRNDAYLDWMIDNVADLKLWYQNESGRNGGRGRWIEATAVDYADFRPGENAPVPGAYVAVTEYSYGPPAEYTSMRYSHSLIVDEMWVNRDSFGNVFNVEVTLIQGNSGNEVIDETWLDLLSFTPQGSGWESHWRGDDGLWNTADDIRRKIYGFGVDLDQFGQPIYDPTRFHEIDHPPILRVVEVAEVVPEDDDWDSYVAVLPDWIAYSDAIAQSGPPVVKWGFGVADPVPDGNPQTAMSIPAGFVGEVLVVLRAPYPLPIRGFELTWGPGYVPRGYTVEFFHESQQAEPAAVPDLGNAVPPEDLAVTLPVLMDEPLEGVTYVRIFFPAGSVIEPAVLQEIRFRHEGSPWEDAPGNSVEPQQPVFVDIKPGSCPNPVRARAGGVLPVAILGGGRFDVTSIDPASVRIAGVAPLRWAYEDVATPFIGSPGACHDLEGDGFTDLTLKFRAAEISAALGLETRLGETIVVELHGELLEGLGGTPILGQDWIRVHSRAPWQKATSRSVEERMQPLLGYTSSSMPIR
jgi:hypothetical protein